MTHHVDPTVTWSRLLDSARDPRPVTSPAWARVEAEAAGLVSKSAGLTNEKAIELVMKRRPGLVAQYYREAHRSEPFTDPSVRR